MKTLMRVLTLLIVLLAVILMFNYCGKSNTIPPDEGGEDLVGMLSLNVPTNFDWEMSNSYDFIFRNGSFGVIEITSADLSTIYHRGSYIEGSGSSYDVNLSIPSFVSQVRINGDLIDLSSSTIDVDMALKAAPINYKADFNGVSTVLTLGDINELDAASTFTIESWAVVNDWSPATNQEIFEKLTDGSNRIAMWLEPTGALEIYVNNAGVSKGSYTPTLSDGDCFHFAIVYNGAGGTDADRLKLYINGSPVSLSFTGTIPATTANMTGDFGSDGSGAPGFFDGSLDELRIWSTVRSATEISDNRFLSLIGNEAGLAAYYQMNEGVGAWLNDKTGSYPVGTLSSQSWSVNTCNSAGIWLDDDFDGIPDASDDYPEDPLRAYDNHWPASDTGTLVFEDLYPGFGDYDFNDMVLGYKFKTVTSATNKVVEIFSYTKVRAHGAQLDNGFGFQLPNAVAGLLADLSVSGYSHSGSLVSVNARGLENAQTKPVIIVLDKVSNVMDKFVNTHETGLQASPVTITVLMTPMANDYTMANFDLSGWNPFLIIDQTRGYELHLAGNAPTDLGSASYFQTFEDSSVPASGRYYVTGANLPWALDFPTSFQYPFEKKEITATYLHFREWAESGGTLFADWYSNTATGYRNSIYIYTP
jgi:LruC domain-containing protein